MKILYFWCDEYLNLRNYNCNLSGNINFSYDNKLKKLIGVSKERSSDNFFNVLDEKENLIPVEISAIVGINGIGKTTTLKIVSEILSNKGSVVTKEYKRNYIFIYEINNKKYIIFENGFVNEIYINSKKIPLDCFENNTSEYTINIFDVVAEKLYWKEDGQTIEFPELNSVATLFLSNSYEKTCDNKADSNSINLSYHYLLNTYLKGKSDLFKIVDFKDRLLNPFDFWQMELLNWDIQFMCSTIYEKLIKSIKLVAPKYFNIMLDYTSENHNLFDSHVKRFNNNGIDKFNFEQFIEMHMKKSSQNNFFDFLNQRICDLIAELILSEQFIKKEKVVEFINDGSDFKKFNSIVDLLENIAINLEEKKEEFINNFLPSNNSLMKKQIQIIHSRIKEFILSAAKMIKNIENIKCNCCFEEKLIRKLENIKDVGDGIISSVEVNVPILTKEINKTESNKEIFDFLRELANIQNEFYNSTKVLPFYINASGLSSGQKACVQIFSKLFKFSDMIKDNKEVNNIVILMDELDIHLHPEWKRKLIYLLNNLLKILFDKEKYKSIHVIMTTNEPYILSDIPKNNTVLLCENKENDEVKIKKDSEYKTLGANIIDLLDDAFFLADGNKGEYITEVIRKISTDSNNKEISKEQIRYYIDIVKLIEEPLIQNSLMEKLSEKMGEDYKTEMIEYYERLINALKNGGESNVEDTMQRKQ